MARFWRFPTLKSHYGRSRSATYEDIKAKLLPRPIKLGPRAVAWISTEVEAIIAARIAGHTDNEIRALVLKLEAARKAAA